MVKTNLLNQLIESSGVKKSHIANALGITREGMSRKLSAGRFTCDEALIIAQCLHLSNEETLNVFLCD